MKQLSTLLADTANFGPGIQPPTDSFSKGSAADATGRTAAANLEHFVSNVIGGLTILAGLFFIFYFVTGGLNWITAGGEQGKITKARDQMIQGVVGLIVIVASYMLIGVVGQFVGLDLLNPTEQFLQRLDPRSRGTTTAPATRSNSGTNTNNPFNNVVRPADQQRQ